MSFIFISIRLDRMRLNRGALSILRFLQAVPKEDKRGGWGGEFPKETHYCTINPLIAYIIARTSGIKVIINVESSFALL